MDKILGIDVGATGIKGNIVDARKGIVLAERKKIKTPTKSTPEAVLAVIKELVDHFDWKGKPIGIGFPAIVKNGQTESASNIDDAWLGFQAEKFLSKGLNCKLTLVNDADAAGIAEMDFGQGVGHQGTVLLLTLGTGIGSALFSNGLLVPNLELGHLKWKNRILEKCVSNKAREINRLSWRTWGKELNKGLAHVDFLFSPDLIIIGGGISRNFDLFGKYLTKTKCPIIDAKMHNDAGIIGAAMAYHRSVKNRKGK